MSQCVYCGEWFGDHAETKCLWDFAYFQGKAHTWKTIDHSHRHTTIAVECWYCWRLTKVTLLGPHRFTYNHSAASTKTYLITCGHCPYSNVIYARDA